MSGPLTVALTILGFYVSGGTWKRLWWILALLCGLYTAFSVWLRERVRVEAIEAKFKLPEISIKIFEVHVLPSAGPQHGTAYVFTRLKLHNLNPDVPTDIDRYKAILLINGREYQSEEDLENLGTWHQEIRSVIALQNTTNHLWGEDIRQWVTNSKPLKRGSPVEGWLGFYFRDLPVWPVEVMMEKPQPVEDTLEVVSGYGRYSENVDRIKIIVTDPFDKDHVETVLRPWKKKGQIVRNF